MRLFTALTASVIVVLGSPYVGELRAAMQAAVADRYVAVLLAAVALPAAAVLTVGLARIARDRARARMRLQALAAAFGVAAGYAAATRTGDVERDAVEAFHFVLYGLVAWLFYRVWRDRGVAAAVVLPVAATAAVGIFDEWGQWLVPTRVGELRDVLLNAVAGVCGVLLGTGLAPPSPVASGRRAPLLAAASVIVLAALFVHTVHLGVEIVDPRIGQFRSRYDEDALRRLAAARERDWRATPAGSAALFSIEDRYLAEARWHERRRNEAWSDGDMDAAWRENLILETYFRPVLDLASPGSRWPDEQRAAAEAGAGTQPYESAAEPFPIVTISPWLLWGGVGVLVAAGVAAAGLAARRDGAAGPAAV